jgi:phosphoribosylformylglycinamidine cyclo-ligase
VPTPADDTATYRDAGVDIDAADRIVSAITPLAARTHDDRVLRGLGHFGGFYRVGPADAGATLVASVDGVGTKLKIAALAGRYGSIGADIVHHCLNDIIACGAKPLFFLDYYGAGRLDADIAITVIGGIAAACESAGVALIGGETAEMPGVYGGDDFDLVGAIVGMVDRDDVIDGSMVMVGDLVIGLPSNGFHTNGYSLVRAALRLNDDDASRERLHAPAPFDASRSLADALLEPHRAYRVEVEQLAGIGAIRAMAHITGGGLPGNVGRVVPDGMRVTIDTSAWTVPALFEYVAEVGHIALDECYRTFNMGIGFVIICPPEQASRALALVPNSVLIGQVRAGRNDSGVTLVEGGLDTT